jgi:hypothetical protein
LPNFDRYFVRLAKFYSICYVFLLSLNMMEQSNSKAILLLPETELSCYLFKQLAKIFDSANIYEASL